MSPIKNTEIKLTNLLRTLYKLIPSPDWLRLLVRWQIVQIKLISTLLVFNLKWILNLN